MLIAREDAAELLRRCCVGHGAGECDRGCGPGRSATPATILRDPGPTSGTWVFAPRVLRELDAIVGSDASPGNAVRPLVDGTDSFGAMLDLVRAARDDIRFENFIFRADVVGRTFAEELRSRAEDGIRVRVLHDPAGAVMARTPPADLLFRGSGVEVRLFNLAWPTREARALGRDHRKLVVADGARMVAGGLCLADPWAGNCVRRCTWRDSAVYVEGPAATAAAQAFGRAWRSGRTLLPSRGRAPLEDGQAPAGIAGEVPVRIITDLGPARRTQALLERVVSAARREVLISCPYFVPPRSLVNRLVEAAHRGVEVAVLVPGRNNHPVAGLSAEERLGALLRHGVEVFRWRRAMIHAKTIVVDGEWTLIGSSNLDALSLERNAELNVEIHGSAPGAEMARLFREDCRESAPYTLGDWRYRPHARRLAARAASALVRWQ